MGHKIVLVDDDDDVCTYYKDVLAEAGFDIQCVHSGKELLALLASGVEPDTVIVDIMMPKMSGVELVEELRRRGYAKPIVAVTAGESELRAEAAKAGATQTFVKMTRPAAIIDALKALLKA